MHATETLSEFYTCKERINEDIFTNCYSEGDLKIHPQYLLRRCSRKMKVGSG